MEWGQFAIFLFTMGGMFFWQRTETTADRREILQLIRGIQDEIKDFHIRLEKQDMEFKCKLALQDAEFKSHVLYHHSEKKTKTVKEK